MKKLSEDEKFNRWQAYEEAQEHLELVSSQLEDEDEQKQFRIVAARLRRERDKQ